MSNITIPYQKIQIPAQGDAPAKTIHAPVLKTTLFYKNDEPWTFECRAGFSAKLNSKGIGFLGRDGFFDLFKEVAFNQKVKMFRLKEY